jgi:hypothetical protein
MEVEHVTLGMLTPFLTDRGQVEVNYAVERLANSGLRNENRSLRDQIEKLQADHEAGVNGDTG